MLLGNKVRKEHTAEMLQLLALAVNDAAEYDAATAAKTQRPAHPELIKNVDLNLSTYSARLASNRHGASFCFIVTWLRKFFYKPAVCLPNLLSFELFFCCRWLISNTPLPLLPSAVPLLPPQERRLLDEAVRRLQPAAAGSPPAAAASQQQSPPQRSDKPRTMMPIATIAAELATEAGNPQRVSELAREKAQAEDYSEKASLK